MSLLITPITAMSIQSIDLQNWVRDFLGNDEINVMCSREGFIRHNGHEFLEPVCNQYELSKSELEKVIFYKYGKSWLTATSIIASAIGEKFLAQHSNYLVIHSEQANPFK
jgi:hypothetical protein